MQQVIQLRLIADTRDGLERAIEEMKAKFPGQLSGLQMPSRAGHRGEWLAYGSLIIGSAAPESEPQIIRVDTATGEILG